MLDENISDDERRDLQIEEAKYSIKVTEAQEQYLKEEAAIKGKYKRIRWAYAILFIFVSLFYIPLISPYAKTLILMRNSEPVQSANKNVCPDTEINLHTKDKSEDYLDGRNVTDTQEESRNLEDSGNEEIIVSGMSFYLDDPIRKLIPTPEMIQTVFYVEPGDVTIWIIVKGHVEKLIDKNLEDAYNGHISSAEGRLANDASMQETDFDDSRKMVSCYAAENNYEKWRGSLKHSTVLDEIIEKRLELWESGKRNCTIASLLANNFQDYALEYQRQNKSGYTVLYYYMQAIIWSEMALSYEDADEEKIFNYIKARYWDIVTCGGIPKEYRERAEAIYRVMGDYEDYIK